MRVSNPPLLLLVHHLPANPGYPRVRLWRRLRRLGAVQLKNAVWALPEGPDALEDFHWLLREIEADGGEGLLCRGVLIAGVSDDQAAALRAASGKLGTRPASLDPDEYPSSHGEGKGLSDRTWVTREGVKVDRIGSAWLIRRYVDPRATFKFVDAEAYVPQEGELRFDMFEGEFTHSGDACTFEVMVSLFAPTDASVGAIAEIVHDVDLHDTRYGRPETMGFQRLLLDGVCRDGVPDDVRLERGFVLFDALQAALRSSESNPSAVGR